MPLELGTDRLSLRQFRDDDLDAFATIQADPVVARLVGDGEPTDCDTSWRLMALFLGHRTQRGFRQYAVEDRARARSLAGSGWDAQRDGRGWSSAG